MNRTLAFCAAIDRFNRRVARSAAWLTVLMVLIASGNAIARYMGKATGTSLSSNAWLEAQWYLFSLVFLLGAPHALRRGGHVRVDVLLERCSERTRLWIDLIGGLVLLIPFCLFALVTSYEFVVDSVRTLEVSPDPGGLSRWPLKLIVPLAFALLLLQAVSEVLRRVAALRNTPGALPETEEDATDA
ncbi:MAG TPA: TRAP transporter small permease subunit [Planctomycetes bacterium]|nr:TRAP transporter small permease subunit [Planctomycetota bacterium]HIL36324.1 TRAP transporter small permease subunit [Planctomycetota bacterium]